MSEPVRLEQTREIARFDPERLEELCVQMGEVRAEAEAAETLGLIGQLLRDIASNSGDFSDHDLADQLAQLKNAADRIGMSTLARVAGDVITCLGRSDVVALSATLARLFRVGDRSIHAVFDLDDQPV